ncbi:unnamed protein product [Linum trigynum]|uniref:Uncharacterized protein n=1 Tax=Linum trigynum TaxID=586398 RepID=A0AAV2FLW9_9ROSI
MDKKDEINRCPSRAESIVVNIIDQRLGIPPPHSETLPSSVIGTDENSKKKRPDVNRISEKKQMKRSGNRRKESRLKWKNLRSCRATSAFPETGAHAAKRRQVSD